MTDSYHFNPNFDHIAYMERRERERLNQLFDGYFTRAAEQANRLVFPSGAAVLTSGDKIVGRVEAEPATTFGAILRRVLDRLGAPAPVAEPIRPALDWDTVTEFDAFPDYVVFHEFEPVAPLHTSPTTDSAYPAIAGLLRG